MSHARCPPGCPWSDPFNHIWRVNSYCYIHTLRQRASLGWIRDIWSLTLQQHDSLAGIRKVRLRLSFAAVNEIKISKPTNSSPPPPIFRQKDTFDYASNTCYILVQVMRFTAEIQYTYTTCNFPLSCNRHLHSGSNANFLKTLCNLPSWSTVVNMNSAHSIHTDILTTVVNFQDTTGTTSANTWILWQDWHQ